MAMEKNSLIVRLIKTIQKNNLGRKGLKKRVSNLKKSNYGKAWRKKDSEFYEQLFIARPLLHENFINFLKSKKDIKTILEVGCGSGIYPIKFNYLFADKEYVGIDIGEPAIEYCKRNSEFDFICGDFIKMEVSNKYDLIFSHAVIDHIYDTDAFLSKIVNICKKYAYISAYRGYFPDLERHKMIWNNEKGCYYNDLSVKALRKTLLQGGLEEDEFIIKSQESGQKGLELETIIIVNKKS